MAHALWGCCWEIKEERKNGEERGEKVGGRLVRETEREEKRIVG